jgi:hypothetical protein
VAHQNREAIFLETAVSNSAFIFERAQNSRTKTDSEVHPKQIEQVTTSEHTTGSGFLEIK